MVKLPRSSSEGFTLMEMLVAVIIVGLAVTVFFQLLSSSMKLTIRGRELLETALVAGEFFDELLDKDVRGDMFEFEGQKGAHPWALMIYPVDVEANDDSDDELNVTLPGEVYAYVLTFYFDEEKKKNLSFTRYKNHPKNYFDDDFKADHLSDPPEQEEPNKQNES
ncbi:MAG: type II secretion system protein [Verrucomicrobiae bacterium]|nr:type II secretion system protein [Verrucomicrobiae bacterium]